MLYGAILDDVQERELVCAAVDDSAVVRSLLDARMLAGALAREVGAEPARRLQLFVAFVDAALMRRKNFLAVWTNEGEFAASADEIWSKPALRDVVESALRAAADGGSATASAVEFDNLTVPGKINALLLACTATPELRDSLQASLGRELGQQHAVPGQWRVTAVKFVATARGGKAGRLWDPNGKPFVLAERPTR